MNNFPVFEVRHVCVYIYIYFLIMTYLVENKR